MAILNYAIAYKNITESYYYTVLIVRYCNRGSTVFRGVLISGAWNEYYTKVSISGSWNRGVPLYTFPNTVFGSNSRSTFEVRLPPDSPTSYCWINTLLSSKHKIYQQSPSPGLVTFAESSKAASLPFSTFSTFSTFIGSTRSPNIRWL